ncbi:MAG: FHA domain-containing protein [Archangium sp.]|nr:FHA domain-containing protein [Archangium sp.]
MGAPLPLSTLARQALMLGSGFNSRYPHPWLVWEPGNRVSTVPSAHGIPVTTVVPVTSPSQPAEGDPLCFALVASPGRTVRVGRSPESDIVVDDLTVSRDHLELCPDAEGWFVRVPRQSSATTLVRKMSLQPGETMRLVDGCAIVAGGVQLTFSAQGKLLARVLGTAERLRG